MAVSTLQLALAAALLAAAAGQQAGGGAECTGSAPPGAPSAAKAVLLDDKSVQVEWLPPSSGDGCVASFTVRAKDEGTGKALALQTVSDGLTAKFSQLYPGATYEFTVSTSGPGGSSAGVAARVTMPPGHLNARPDAPEALKAAAASDNTAKLTWRTPAGNPKVDSFVITAVPVNATGFPLQGGRNTTTSVGGASMSAALSGLKPSGYYVFQVASKSNLGSSPEPAVAFLRMPAPGAAPPGQPGNLNVAEAGPGAVALSWAAPRGSEPDYYNIRITQVDGGGKALSATNEIPFKNTTAIIRDLAPGDTYAFEVQSYSASFDAGQAARITFTVPRAPAARAALAPAAAPGDLQASVLNGQVTLRWSPVPGAGAYVVSLYDAYSGRSLGVQYTVNTNAAVIGGLPLGTAVEFVVQGVSGGYYSPPASALVEIPFPSSSYYYSYYSPYYGYNPYMPYWYSSYYPVGWYNTWYPGKWLTIGIAAALNPFNHFWGPNWWLNRPVPLNPWGPLNPLRPLRPGGWGGWGAGLVRPHSPGKLPGQRPAPATRPAPLPGVVRPGGVGGPTTRPAPVTPPTVGPSTGLRPAPGGVAGGGQLPTMRPTPGFERPVGGGGGVPMTRPTPGFERPVGGGGGVPTTRPTPGFERPVGGTPTTRPAPVPQLPQARPAPMPQAPMARPGPGGGPGGGRDFRGLRRRMM